VDRRRFFTAAALREIKSTLRGAPSDLPFDIHARTIAFGLNFTLQTTFGGFDLLGEVEPIGSFEDVMKNAEEFEFGPWRLWVIGLDDLLRVKEFINRPKDLQSLYELRALKRLRDEKGLR
jgi:hypothetical protein